MILDKVKPYWTDEETSEIWDIRIKQNNVIVLAQDGDPQPDYVPDKDSMKKWQELEDRAREITQAVEERYIKDRKPKGLLADAKEIIEAITKEDYQKSVATQTARIASLRKDGIKEENLGLIKELANESYDNCYHYILYYLRVQLNGLVNDEEGTAKILHLADKRALLWYVKDNPAFVPVISSPSTRAFSYMDKKDIKLDLNRNATIEKWGIGAFIEKYGDLPQSLNINADKLLGKSIEVFTRQHHTGSTASINPVVVIDIKEYATELGYDIVEHPTNTPEEAKEEKKRAQNQLKNAKKDIKKSRDILYAYSLDLPLKGDKGDNTLERRRRLLDGVDQDSESVMLIYSLPFATHMAEQHTLTTFPTCLRKIPATQPNAYYLGKKIAEHSFMYANQKKGTDNLLSVKTLLAVTNLPTYEEVQEKDRGHWEDRIKDRLEANLGYLVTIGLLEEWEYTHSKGRKLTDKEAYSIDNYYDFEALYIAYKIKDKPYQKDQIEANEQKHKDNREKAQRKRKRAKKKES